MKLDNEEQRGLLLQIVQNIPLSGDYKGLTETIKRIDALVLAINDAGIDQVNEAKVKSE